MCDLELEHTDHVFLVKRYDPMVQYQACKSELLFSFLRRVYEYFTLTSRAPPSLLSILWTSNGQLTSNFPWNSDYNFTVYPGNTYDYAPFNEANASMFYNNLYGKGNCLDRLQDCKDTGDNAVVSKYYSCIYEFRK
jgi:hypothetical protein